MISVAWLSSRKLVAIIIACALIVFLRVSLWDFFVSDPRVIYGDAHRNTLLSEHRQLWQVLSKDLADCDPSIEKLNHPENTNLDIFYNASDPRRRPSVLQMSVRQRVDLRKAHAAFVERIRTKNYGHPYNSETRGVVTTAGGPYLPVALVSIRMLRETGSNLPVEVFLSNWKEFDPVICGKILPSLNAKCLVLQDIFDDNPNSKISSENKIDKYQYKIMSILFSSFEDVLFLDSDCFPIRNPEPLFDSEPFNSTGLVLWPDFWFPSESPHFFDIANISAPPIDARASTEAGEILYSKRKHELSLLLAAYYNYYGPEHYYPLQSQGAPGEGDKETFLWSAVALNAPFYHVQKPVHALGYKTKDGEWRGSAMAQFDPEQDFFPNMRDPTSNATYPRPYFAHVNFPKLDPGQIFEYMSFGAAGPTKDSDDTMRRIWHANMEDAVDFFGFDLERSVWKVVKEIACEYQNDFGSWKGKRDICKKAEAYWNAVFGD